MNIIIWLALGVVVGFIAGKIMKGSGFGIIRNIIIGIIGGFIGGWLAGLLGISGASTNGFSVASILTATGGAIALLFMTRLIKKS